MPFQKFGNALQNGFFSGVAGAGTIKFAQHPEPVQGQPDNLAIGKTRGGVKIPGTKIQDGARRFRIYRIVYRFAHFINAYQILAKKIFGLLPGCARKIGATFKKAEKGIAFHHFHERGSPGLGRA